MTGGHIPDIKLIRTDTTLDLSHKAKRAEEKRKIRRVLMTAVSEFYRHGEGGVVAELGH